MEYRSSIAPFGIPLIHVMTGSLEAGQYRRGVAKGWIAVGDMAFGILFAAGGVASGALAFGGLPLGLLAVGGFAIGALVVGGGSLGIVAIGGLAMAAYMAAGGLAIGWYAAFGGLAIAREVAAGGAAVARHANDAVARDFFANAGWYGDMRAAMPYAQWLLLVFVLLAIVAVMRRSAESR